VLHVKGELSAKDKSSVAMDGSRMTTHYGIETVRKLAYQLAYLGSPSSPAARAVLTPPPAKAR
jgi:predicted Rossmann fold nucleotide-binding protein DprA/Smf involved in DNA uptake